MQRIWDVPDGSHLCCAVNLHHNLRSETLNMYALYWVCSHAMQSQHILGHPWNYYMSWFTGFVFFYFLWYTNTDLILEIKEFYWFLTVILPCITISLDVFVIALLEWFDVKTNIVWATDLSFIEIAKLILPWDSDTVSNTFWNGPTHNPVIFHYIFMQSHFLSNCECRIKIFIVECWNNVCSVVLNMQPLSFYIKNKYDHLISMILYFSMK